MRDAGLSPRDENDGFVAGPAIRRTPTGTGALDGLTFGVKDLIDLAGVPTGGGNPDWAATHASPARSAPVVDALLAAGAELVGKTITDELAFSLEGRNIHFGTPRNPACPDRLPGGSSSGSASVVAAGLADFALGTDTGGSVRIPASFCGLYGFRPTHGALSLDGVMPFAPLYDTVGWFARDANVLACVGDALLPHGDTKQVVRFRLVADAFALADADVAARMRAMLQVAGPPSEISVFDGQPDAWRETYRICQGADIARTLGPWLRATRPRFAPDIAARFADALAITPAEARSAQDLRQTYAARLAGLVGDGEVLVLPTAPGPALRRAASPDETGDFYRRALPLTAIAVHAGLPQVTIPALRIDGCPVGLSLVGARGTDRALLAAAARWPIDHHA